jgi:hypothetical protein
VYSTQEAETANANIEYKEGIDGKADPVLDHPAASQDTDAGSQ